MVNRLPNQASTSNERVDSAQLAKPGHFNVNKFINDFLKNIIEFFNNLPERFEHFLPTLAGKPIQKETRKNNPITPVVRKTIAIEPSFSQEIQITDKGIANSGNTCYIAATLQALLKVPHFKQALINAQDTSSPFYALKKLMAPLLGIEEPKRNLKTDETEAIRTFLRTYGWMAEEPTKAMGDPVNLVEFLFDILLIPPFAVTTKNKKTDNTTHILSLPARLLEHSTSLKKLVAPTSDTKKAYKLTSDTLPEILPVCIQGRTNQDTGKNTTRVVPSQQLEIAVIGDQDSKATYHLRAVIVYPGEHSDGGHYLTYAPLQEDTWVKYDDSTVTTTKREHQMIERHSYIYLYSLEK